MPSQRHIVPVVALVLMVAACQSSPAASTSVPPATPAVASSAPSPIASPATAAPPTTTTASPEGLGGTWTLALGDPRILSATGDYVGGSVVIEGDRVIFTANDYRAERSIELSGTKDLDCDAEGCYIDQTLWAIFPVDGQLAVVHAGTLTPLGSFGDTCGWEDVPDGGVLSVQATGTVGGTEVPTVVTFTAGEAGGTGEACADGSWSVAWDVTATRRQ